MSVITVLPTRHRKQFQVAGLKAAQDVTRRTNGSSELVVSEVEEVMETPEAGPVGRPASAPVRRHVF